MRTMLISAKRLQLAGFYEHWHTHGEPSLELSDDRGSGRDAGVGAMVLQRLMNLQREQCHPHWKQLAERIAETLKQDLSDFPTSSSE